MVALDKGMVFRQYLAFVPNPPHEVDIIIEVVIILCGDVYYIFFPLLV